MESQCAPINGLHPFQIAYFFAEEYIYIYGFVNTFVKLYDCIAFVVKVHLGLQKFNDVSAFFNAKINWFRVTHEKSPNMEIENSLLG